MGVPSVKGALKRLYPTVFRQGNPEGVHFMVQELLPQLRSFDREYGTEELINLILDSYAMFLRSPQHTFVAVVADESKYVPRRKADVQASRLESWTKAKSTAADGSANKPYPAGAYLVTYGVAVPPTPPTPSTEAEPASKLESQPPSSDAPAPPTIEKLTVARLCFSRPLRMTFFQQLVDAAVKFGFPAHAFVLMDVGLKTGPVLIHGGRSHSWAHVSETIGEGEMLALYWTRYLLESFPQAHVLLKTVDTDVLPIAYHMYKTLQLPSCNVSWVHLPKQYVNLRQLFKLMNTPYQPSEEADYADLKGCVWHTDNFLGSCALSGSDYTTKADTSPGIGPDFIFDAAFAMWKIKCTDEEKYFRALVKAAHDRKGKTCTVLNNAKAERYRYALDEYQWVVKYWRTLGLGGVYAELSLRQKAAKEERTPVAIVKMDLDKEAELFTVPKKK